jgi:hypothetical protein
LRFNITTIITIKITAPTTAISILLSSFSSPMVIGTGLYVVDVVFSEPLAIVVASI